MIQESFRMRFIGLLSVAHDGGFRASGLAVPFADLRRFAAKTFKPWKTTVNICCLLICALEFLADDDFKQP